MDGAIFGNKHSEEDYGAVMNYARVTPPAVKENYVDIAGGDSAIDLTEAVGGVVFEDGKIDFKFTLFTARDKDNMKNDLHGKRVRIILERDSDYFYDGRLAITGEGRNGNLYELDMEARVKPYKTENQSTVFVQKVTSPAELILESSRMPAMPTITVDGEVTVLYDGMSFPLQTGVYEIPEITFREGLNRLNVLGTGEIRLEYRKGRLI